MGDGGEPLTCPYRFHPFPPFAGKRLPAFPRRSTRLRHRVGMTPACKELSAEFLMALASLSLFLSFHPPSSAPPPPTPLPPPIPHHHHHHTLTTVPLFSTETGQNRPFYPSFPLTLIWAPSRTAPHHRHLQFLVVLRRARSVRTKVCPHSPLLIHSSNNINCSLR